MVWFPWLDPWLGVGFDWTENLPKLRKNGTSESTFWVFFRFVIQLFECVSNEMTGCRCRGRHRGSLCCCCHFFLCKWISEMNVRVCFRKFIPFDWYRGVCQCAHNHHVTIVHKRHEKSTTYIIPSTKEYRIIMLWYRRVFMIIWHSGVRNIYYFHNAMFFLFYSLVWRWLSVRLRWDDALFVHLADISRRLYDFLLISIIYLEIFVVVVVWFSECWSRRCG